MPNRVSCRARAELFEELRTADLEDITALTGCLKPCKYRRYSFFSEKKSTAFTSNYFTFSLCSLSEFTRVEVEELIYPFSSLVAEFGGTLSLFLGFSFMTFWDGLKLLSETKCKP